VIKLADVLGWVSDVLATPIATVDTVVVTLGLVIATGMLITLAVRAAKKFQTRS